MFLHKHPRNVWKEYVIHYLLQHISLTSFVFIYFGLIKEFIICYLLSQLWVWCTQHCSNQVKILGSSYHKLIMVKKIRLDQSVGLVRLGSDPQVGPVISLKLSVLKTCETSVIIGQNRQTGPITPIDQFS